MKKAPDGFRICDAEGCQGGRVQVHNEEYDWDFCERCHGDGVIVEPIYGWDKYRGKDPLIWLREAMMFIMEDVTLPDQVYDELHSVHNTLEELYVDRVIAHAEEIAESR